MLAPKRVLAGTGRRHRLPLRRWVQWWVIAFLSTTGGMASWSTQVGDGSGKVVIADQELEKTREAFGVSTALWSATAARLQEAEKRQTRIVVAPILVAAPVSLVDFEIQIVAATPVPPESALEIRGLPPLVTLSAGKALNASRRSWTLPPNSLPHLKMQLPAEASGRWELFLRLITKKYIEFASCELIITSAAVVATLEPPDGSVAKALSAVARATTAAGAPLVTRTPLVAAKETIPGKFALLDSGGQRTESARADQLTDAANGVEKRLPEALLNAIEPRFAGELLRSEKTSQNDGSLSGARAGGTDQAQIAHLPEDQEPRGAVIPNARSSVKMTVDLQPRDGGDQPGAIAEAGSGLLVPGAAIARAQGDQRQSTEKLLDPMISVAEVDMTRLAMRDGEPKSAAANKEQAERLVHRGDRYLAQGNVAVARQYYQRAADSGEASAAIKLAETHDPFEIPRLRVLGLAANPSEAKRWYRRASSLGAVAAEDRLLRLNAH